MPSNLNASMTKSLYGHIIPQLVEKFNSYFSKYCGKDRFFFGKIKMLKNSGICAIIFTVLFGGDRFGLFVESVVVEKVLFGALRAC